MKFQKMSVSYMSHMPKLIFIGLFAFIISSCANDPTPDALPTLVEFPTDAPAEDATEAVQVVIETDEPAQTPAVEEPASAESETLSHQTADQSLQVLVTTINTSENTPNMPEAPDGQQFILLTTNLSNFTGEEITTEATSFTLIDENQNRYQPIAPDDFLVVPVFGITLDGATSIVGSIRFSIPVGEVPAFLEWCPMNDCDSLILRVQMP